MKISMYSKFQILQKENGELIPLSKSKVNDISIGGYYFIIDGKEIPFDWDAFSGDCDGKIFEFETGYGFVFDEFELSDCYDEDYEELGIKREYITAEFLASVEKIKEFHINFIDNNDKECDFGCNDETEKFKLELLAIVFTDIETGKEYSVDREVLYAYNN